MPIFSGEYPQKSTPVDNDKALIADSESSNAVKGLTLANLVDYVITKLQAVSLWISTGMLQNQSVTTAKVDTGSWVDVPGVGNYSGSNLSVRVSGGVATLNGTIYRNSGSITNGDSVATIPAAYRPSMSMNLVGGGTSTTVHKIAVAPSGAVSVITAGTGNHINVTASYPVDN